MIIPDANLLLYAHLPSFSQHSDSKKWLVNFISDGSEVVGLPLQVIMAFIRISTNIRLFENPLTVEEATENIDLLLQHPLIEMIAPAKKTLEYIFKIS